MEDLSLVLFTGTRLLHVLGAVVLMGGAAFLRFVLLPAISQTLTEEQHAALRTGVLPRWKKLVHAAIGVLLISGGINYVRMILALRTAEVKDPVYHAVLGTKIILAMAIFVIASGLVGKSAAFAGLRNNAKKWLLISLCLGVTILGMSAYLRVRPSRLPGAAAAVGAPARNP